MSIASQRGVDCSQSFDTTTLFIISNIRGALAFFHNIVMTSTVTCLFEGLILGGVGEYFSPSILKLGE
jgi:hypothetical protein